MIKFPVVLFAAVAIAAPAIAQTPSFAFQFHFDRAELATADGAARVHEQLVIAANATCRRKAPSAQRTVDTVCRETLVDAVLKQIDSPLLEATSQGGARPSAR